MRDVVNAALWGFQVEYLTAGASVVNLWLNDGLLCDLKLFTQIANLSDALFQGTR